MTRIFISHSSEDNFYALAFQSWLVEQGWDPEFVFLDLKDIEAGMKWKDALKQAHEQCESVVFLASPASLESTECLVEIRMAENYGKPIIPAIIHSLEPNDERLKIHSDRQVLDLSIEPLATSIIIEYKGKIKSINFNPSSLEKMKKRLDNLGALPTMFPWRPASIENSSPYPGFGGYSTSDAGIFFGRDGNIASGLAELRKLILTDLPHIFVIQGASGAGKSSFLKAGLWPRLERDRQFITLGITRPGTGILSGETGIGHVIAKSVVGGRLHKKPFEINELLTQENEKLAAQAFADLINEAIMEGFKIRKISSPQCQMPTPIIAVDQAEELLASENREQSHRFLKFLSLLFTNKHSNKFLKAPLLIFTIRADSVDALLHMTTKFGIKTPITFPLPPISQNMYLDVIRRPMEAAERAHLKISIDPELVTRLIAESTGADALPLLSFTLKQLVSEARLGNKANLTQEQYDAIGGLGGVLAKQLGKVLHKANIKADVLSRLVMSKLVAWDAQSSPPMAKRVIAREEELFENEYAKLKPLVDLLVEERMFTRSSAESKNTTLEVAHEALLRQPPISNWLEQHKEFLFWRSKIKTARLEHAAKHRDFLTKIELDIARDWVKLREADIDMEDLKFYEDSIENNKKEQTQRERNPKNYIGERWSYFYGRSKGKVFINYRRSVNLKEAQLLSGILERRFGRSRVFIDVSGLDGGENWLHTLTEQIEQCAAMVVLIGPEWCDLKDEYGERRLDQAKDFVRFEIAHALNIGIPVLPVLVNGASMPSFEELPLNIRPLNFIQAMLFRNSSFEEDAEKIGQRLIRLIAGVRQRGISYTRAVVLSLVMMGLGGILGHYIGS